ncbi:MAG: MFS transporter [Flaviflexus sp.]|nr:MFS transporter [Flaviflexus sp.]
MKRDYYLWLTGTTADQFANSIRSLVLPIIVVAITGSVTAAGTLEATSKVIFAVLALFGGVLVDRIDRRTGIYARAAIGCLVWLAATILLAIGQLTYPVLFSLVVIATLTEAMFGFADDAALRSIVTEDRAFASAQSVIQARRAIISLLGGPVGGLLYAAFSWLPFGVTAGALALLGTTAVLIKTNLSADVGVTAPASEGAVEDNQAREDECESDADELRDAGAVGSSSDASEEVKAEEKKGSVSQGIVSVWKDLAEGFKLVFSDAVKRPIALVSAIMGFSSTLMMTLVIYRLIQLEYTAFQISLVEVAAAIGMFIGAPASGILMRKVPTGRLVIAILAVISFDFFAFALAPSYNFLFIWFAVYGLCMPIVSAPMLGYFYARTPQNMQGRSAAIMTVAGMGLAAFAPVVSGILVSSNKQIPGLLGGAILMSISALILLSSPKVRQIGLPEAWSSNS